jgi:cation:H+ antiporter
VIGALTLIALGFAILVAGSDRFVGGAAGLALRLKISPIVVGAVIVGFGTSAPELLASALASARGSLGIAIGNIAGSNLANLTLVLGVVAIMTAPTIASRVLRRELPVMLAAMGLFALCLPWYSRSAGLLLIAAFAIAIALTLRATHVEGDPMGPEVEHELEEQASRPTRRLIVETLVGLVATVGGAQLLVSGAVSVADRAGVGEGLVGFTLVALGTSLPELVTCIQASRRGDADLAIGNVFGSNVFNSLGVGGVSALIGPGDVANSLVITAFIGVVVAGAVGVMMMTGRRLVRWEGIVLVLAYLATVPIVA